MNSQVKNDILSNYPQKYQDDDDSFQLHQEYEQAFHQATRIGYKVEMRRYVDDTATRPIIFGH